MVHPNTAADQPSEQGHQQGPGHRQIGEDPTLHGCLGDNEVATRPQYVVVIGASAGGLEAIQDLIGRLSPHHQAAYVIAQHLSPDHPSELRELLHRGTYLPVVTGRDGLVLEADQIVVLPPNCDASLAAATLQLSSPEPRYSPSPSIDRLFQSLAGQWSDHAVGIVLSGTGSDGALGLRTIAEAGGLTLVQQPETARFGGMPAAAIALSHPDLVADPGTLAERLCAWFASGGSAMDGEGNGHGEASVESEAQPPGASRRDMPSPADTAAGEAVAMDSLADTLAQLKHTIGIDFSKYKESTLRRQLQRRMAIRGTDSIDDYLPLLAAEVSEAQALAHNLLVSVTCFFRNPDAFAALAEPLRQLIRSRRVGERLRVWVPGCASGEEVYSIAMCVSEAMGHPANLTQALKIFATDLDEQSLAIARRAIYPMAAASNIPPPLFERFAQPLESSFEFSKELRSCIVFARHNLWDDPPFPNIDLISCRNTLIYFQPVLQERVIELLSYSLQPGGLLFLGSSESLSRPQGFRVLNPVHRLYCRTSERRNQIRQALTSPLHSPPIRSLAVAKSPAVKDSVPEQHVRLLEALIRSLAHPALVMDEDHQWVEVVGDVSPFCRLPEGAMPAVAGAFLREELQAEAKALVLLVLADHQPASSASLSIEGLPSPVRLEAKPLPLADRSLTVLSFILEPEVTTSAVQGLGSLERDAAFTREIDRLERELLSSQDTLRRSMADLEQANEELEASSEELQASSEELQSSNEELEASNEELQATNEELSTLNQQLRTRSDELEHLNNDLENIQGSLNQGMVIVDRQLRITRFSPLAVRVFGLVETDLGQPLVSVPTTVPLPELREALLAAVQERERRTLEAGSEDVAYLVQVMPYCDRAGLPLGAIVTLTDVSEPMALRRAAEAALHEFASLADALDPVVWKRDHTLSRILYISHRVQELTGWSAAEICANPSLLDAAILPGDQAAVRTARQGASSGWRVTYRLRLRDGSEIALQEVARVLDDPNDDRSVVGTLTEVTELRRLERRNQLLACAFQATQATETLPLALLDEALCLVTVSESFAALFGQPPPELIGQPLATLAQRWELQSRGAADALVSGLPLRQLQDLALQALRSQQPLRGQRLEADPSRADSLPIHVELIPLGPRGDGLGLLVRLAVAGA
ncbi:MAG: CheR family methyltransferase [Synechococcaceae cyanobacterium]